MRRNLFTIAATIVVALLCVAPAAAQTDPRLTPARLDSARASLDSARARVWRFLEADSAVQTVSATRRQFLLIEDREGILRIVAHVVSKVDLHQLGRATGGHDRAALLHLRSGLTTGIRTLPDDPPRRIPSWHVASGWRELE